MNIEIVKCFVYIITIKIIKYFIEDFIGEILDTTNRSKNKEICSN
jgi:hypothetical protein